MTDFDEMVKRPSGFRDQVQLPEQAAGIYGRDALDLPPLPSLTDVGAEGIASDGDDLAVEDEEGNV